MEGYIYKYTFSDGKVYIGQTRRPLEMRHREHLNPSTGYCNTGFWEAYQRLGEPTRTVLETVEAENVDELVVLLNQLETAYILKYKATDPRYGYNKMPVATAYMPERALLNKEVSRLYEQAKSDKQPFFDSVTRKVFEGGTKFTEEEKIFIKSSLLDNNPFADALREEIDLDSFSLRDNVDGFFFEEAMEFAVMVYMEETRDIIEQYVSENAEVILKNGRSGKVIQQIDKEGKIVREFWSTDQLREALGISRIDNITNVLKGRQKSAYGYNWRYKTAEE